jgi:hypothetical protein
MPNKVYSNCKIGKPHISEDCPEKCDTGKTCWETSFLHNNWQKVFEMCKHCKVFQQSLTKYK